MPVIVRPDIVGAVIARLRSFSEITALTGTRISAELQDAWPMPTHAVRIRQTGGPPPDVQVNLQRTRFDVTCYGSNGLEAARLMNVVGPALAPDQMTRSSFIQGAVRVYDVVPEAGVISDVDRDNGWHFCWQPFMVRWSGVPVS